MIDKYQKAIVEYASAGNAIKQLKIEIFNSLDSCRQAQVDASPGGYLLEIIEHLKYAYDGTRDDDGEFHHENGDPAEYLSSVCPKCLHAHNLIQDRKQARKRFGIAKRRITMLGKELCR